ncbi:hypothetical protein [Pseudonocardia sp. HH130630-07]|uniref:hypothetical protein n=1 Tax=Pseudonocardia sp. HH130630-07 TaxID=1690815 RepID=UPI0008150822|nr:hypothetical protein [Pseudonocardia sp. HH130630-07]ANY08016.1 hypothetical protein AFB00_18870 [Pseudonocardia sp. HH130630-07]
MTGHRPPENAWFDDADRAGRPDPVPGDGPLPGSAAAVGIGCRCSVLGNAAYRVGAAETPLHDPACPVHHAPGDAPPPRRPDGTSRGRRPAR